MRKKLITHIETDSEIRVPKEVAVCPICGAGLIVMFENFWKDEDGLWVGEPYVQPICMPYYHSIYWDDWFYSHYSMPYVDWLPVMETVKYWVNQNWRFNLG